MKNILYIFCIILCISLTTSSIFADDCSQSCSINDAPAQALQDYINANRSIISNISNQLVVEDKNNVFKQQGIKIYNSITNWSTFTSGLDFLKLQFSDDVPVPVRRDQDLLKNEGEYLANFLKNMILQNSSNSIIQNACDGIPHCQLDGTAGDILGKIIQNHSNILEYYKLSLLGKESSFKGNLILVKATFKSELHNHYNTYTLTDCSQCELGFQNIIQQSINKISGGFNDSQNGIQAWKDAWSSRNGTKNGTDEYNKKQRELLQKELSKQGINSTSGDIILQNIDRYNNNGYSNQNNPLNNSFSTFNNNIENNSAAVDFASNIYKSVKQLYNKGIGYVEGDNSTVAISELANIESNITVATTIMQEIDNNYEKQIPFISAQDMNSDKLQARIIQMHVDLSQAINILDKTIEFSEKVCNDQDKGNGKCHY